jgi:flagellar basal body-associated protein FliL
MPDYNIPMEAAPQQIQQQNIQAPDANIPLSVKPFKQIDGLANAGKAMDYQQKGIDLQNSMIDAQSKLADHEDEMNDRTILQAAQKSGANFHSEEGIDQILAESGDKLSQKSISGLMKRKAEIQKNTIDLQTHLGDLDDRTLTQMHSTMERAYKDIEVPLKRYDETMEAAALADDIDPNANIKATEAFNSAKHAIIGMYRNDKDPVTGKTRIPEEKLKEMEAATIDDWRGKVQEADYKVKQVKEAADLKAKNAKSARDEAEALRAAALAEKALEGDKGGSGTKKHLESKTVIYDGKQTLADYDPSTGEYYRGSTKLDREMVEPSEKGLGGLAGRDSVYTKRIMNAADQASKDLVNIVEQPIESSTGFFGGRHQMGGLLDAAKETLVNKMSTQETQDYTIAVAGLKRVLSTIEASGLAPPGALTEAMDAVVWKEGDTNMSKLKKLAQARQIVESGLEVQLADPKVSPEQKQLMKDIITRTKDAIPYTYKQVQKFQSESQKHPKMTMNQLIAADKLSAKPAADTPIPQSVNGGPPASDEDKRKADREAGMQAVEVNGGLEASKKSLEQMNAALAAHGPRNRDPDLTHMRDILAAGIAATEAKGHKDMVNAPPVEIKSDQDYVNLKPGQKYSVNGVVKIKAGAAQ